MKPTGLILCVILCASLLRLSRCSLFYTPYVPKSLDEEIYISSQDPSFRPLWWAVMRDAPLTTISNLVLSTPGIIQKEEAQNNTQCALVEAVGKRRRDVVVFLLTNGANPRPYFRLVEELTMDDTASTPMLIAESNSVEFIREVMRSLGESY